MAFFYNDSSVPSHKHLVEHDLQSQLFEFRKNRQKNLYAFEPAPMFWHVKARPTHFSKDTHMLKPLSYREGDKASILQTIKRKGIYESFTLHTQADKIKEMTRWGIVATSSLTGNVISALGKYRLITMTDRIMAGYISNRHHEKFWLLDLMQDRFEALEQLENLVNQNISYLELPEALANMRAALRQYIADLRAIQQKTPLNDLESIDDDIARAEEYLRNVNEDNFALHNQATGPYSILSFVRDTLLDNLNEMQGINKSLTYNISDKQFAGTSGDLNSSIVDAYQVMNDHEVDLHNSVLNGHHGVYGKKSIQQNDDTESDAESEKNLFAYNSWQHNLSAKDQQRALVAISFIEGMNELHFPSTNDIAAGRTQPFIRNAHGRFDLRVVAATKWQMTSPFGSLSRLLANFTVRVLGGFFDLFVVLATYPFKSYEFIQNIRKTTESWATKEFNILETDLVDNPALRGGLPVLAGYEIRDAARPRLTSLASKVGRLLLNLYDNTVVDSVRGIKDVLRQFTLKAAHTLQDYHDEGYEKREFEVVMDEVEQEALAVNKNKEDRIKEIKATQHERVDDSSPDSEFLHQVIDKKYVDVAEQKDSEEEKLWHIAEKYAMTEYVPTGAEMNDLFNAVVRGGQKFTNLYMHNIFAKHKVVGMVFTAMYVAAGLSVLMPEVMSKLVGTTFVGVAQAMGHATASGTTSSAVAAAVNESQFAAALLEFAFHGPQSWFVTGANELASDPATTFIYVGAAMLIGYLAVYVVDIPGLSEELRSNMGTVPPLALGFAGAKIGVLLVEFLHAKEREELDQVDCAINKIKKFLEDLYRKNHPEIQDLAVINGFVERSTTALLSVNNLKQFQEVYGNAHKAGKDFKIPGHKTHVDNTIKRFRVSMFIEENMDVLPNLSPHKKHELMRQIKSLFSETPEQALSYKKLLYPEGTRSIMRTTLSVVFGLGSAFLLLCFAGVSSLYHGNLKPLNRAIDEYVEKIQGIKTRIIYGASILVQTTISVVNRILILTPLDILMNSVGARLFTMATGSNWLTRMNYKVSAAFDRVSESFYQRMSSWSGLSDDLKDFTAPHHADTRNKVAASYLTIFKALVPENGVLPEPVQKCQQQQENSEDPDNVFKDPKTLHLVADNESDDLESDRQDEFERAIPRHLLNGF